MSQNEVLGNLQAKIFQGIYRLRDPLFRTPLPLIVNSALNDPLFRNSLILMVTCVFEALAGFAFWIVATRLYLASDIGLVAAFIAAMGLLSNLASLGLHISVIRFLPQERDKAGLINTVSTLTGGVSILAAVIFIVGLPLWSPALLVLRSNVLLLFCFIFFTMGTTLLMIQRQVFIALRRTETLAVQRMILQGVKILLAVALVSFSLLGLFSSWGVAILLVSGVGLLLIWRAQPDYSPGITIKRRLVGRIAQFSTGSYVAEILSALSTYLLPLLIVNMLGAEHNAYFYIAFRITEAIFALCLTVVLSFFTEGSYDPSKLRSTTIKTAYLLVPLILAGTAVAFLFGDKLLALFGAAYQENALRILWVLALSMAPRMICELYVNIKWVSLRVLPNIYLNLAQLLLIVILSYFLMIKVGVLGVALGWTIGYTVVGIVALGLLLKEGGRGGSLSQTGLEHVSSFPEDGIR